MKPALKTWMVLIRRIAFWGVPAAILISNMLLIGVRGYSETSPHVRWIKVTAHLLWMIPILWAVLISAWEGLAMPPSASLRAWYGGIAAVCLGFHAFDQWNVCETCFDSGGYLRHYCWSAVWSNLRTPGYPLFIQSLGAGFASDDDAAVAGPPRRILIPASQSDGPILRITRAQKLAFFGAALLFLAVLGRLVPFPLRAALTTFPFLQRLVPPYTSTICTETLAVSFILAMLFCLFLDNDRQRLICWIGACAAAASAAAVRPSMAFLLPMLAIVALWSHRQTLRTLASRLAIVFCASTFVVVPNAMMWAQTGRTASTPLASWTKIGRALALGTWDDAELIHSPRVRIMYHRMLESRQQIDARANRTVPGFSRATAYVSGKVDGIELSDWYIWRVAGAALEQALAAGWIDSGKPRWLAADEWFSQISEPILRQHRSERMTMTLDAIFVAVGVSRQASTTRLSRVFPWGSWIVLSLLPLPFIARRCAAAAIVLFGVHVGNILVTCIAHVPLPIYIWLTEFCVLAALLVAWGNLATIFGKWVLHIWHGASAS